MPNFYFSVVRVEHIRTEGIVCIEAPTLEEARSNVDGEGHETFVPLHPGRERYNSDMDHIEHLPDGEAAEAEYEALLDAEARRVQADTYGEGRQPMGP